MPARQGPCHEQLVSNSRRVKGASSRIPWNGGVEKKTTSGQALYLPVRQASQDGLEQGTPASIATRSPVESFLNQDTKQKFGPDRRTNFPLSHPFANLDDFTSRLVSRSALKSASGGAPGSRIKYHFIGDHHGVPNPPMLPEMNITPATHQPPHQRP